MSAAIPRAGDPSEPDNSFQHARLKVRWAEQHVNLAIRLVQEFIEAETKIGATHTDPKHGVGVVGGRPVPPEIALSAGDAIFSLRSALDCCWMGLKRAISTTPDGHKTIPRGRTRKDVVGTLNKALIEQSFPGADELILDKIRAYREGNDVLWLAGEVDNWNKHNMLIFAVHEMLVGNLNITTAAGARIIITNCPVGPNGIGLGTSAFKVNNEANTTMEVVLVSRQSGDERPIVPFLTALLKDTYEAVEMFVATFGKR